MEQQTLYVSPTHPLFADHIDDFRDAYEWMRKQMRERIPNYQGHYPWWAYDHFLDLRRYRWHTPPYGERLVRLELAVPREQVLLSSYGRWHWALNRWYLPTAYDDEAAYEKESDEWKTEAARDGVNVYRDRPFAEPWETQMRASWQNIFDIESRRPTEIIQANFERLELTQVVKATEFMSMPERVSR